MPAGCAIHIGTSGWHYKHWLGDFYPEKYPAAKMFPWYAREFDTVEINNSFYRLPEEKTFQRWRELAPPGFIFAVKASRFITHIKRLKDAEASIELFFSRARPLGATLGPILFQLPPRWKLNLDRLSEFLGILPPGHRYAIEFRDESWCVPQVYDLLARRNIAYCVHDWREMLWPQQLTADFTYIRFTAAANATAETILKPRCGNGQTVCTNGVRGCLQPIYISITTSAATRSAMRVLCAACLVGARACLRKPHKCRAEPLDCAGIEERRRAFSGLLFLCSVTRRPSTTGRRRAGQCALLRSRHRNPKCRQ